jgi:predicted ATP-grasp superfamily ATP-dependent carboligase
MNGERVCALVLGGHVNGYSIIRELKDGFIDDIVLFDDKISLSRFSNKIKIFKKTEFISDTLLNDLYKLNKDYSKIIIYPTDDIYIECLLKIYDQIKEFCFIPFNKLNISKSLDKYYQYKICGQNKIPYPKCIKITEINQLAQIESLMFPIIIKPLSRTYKSKLLFKNIYIKNALDIESKSMLIKNALKLKVPLMVSEVIPGDDSQIYAYSCYRSHEGNILNEWTGKKITQYPDNFGVFSTAVNTHNPKLAELGKKFVEKIDGFGFIQPEFKFDQRDGEFKLMECNFRPMMWHRVGFLSGVKLINTQYEYALGLNVTKYNQNNNKQIKLILMLHEVPNVIFRKNYLKKFLKIVFKSKHSSFGIFNFKDPLPGIFAFMIMIKLILNLCLKHINRN